MSQRESSHEADRDARDVALKGKVARRGRWLEEKGGRRGDDLNLEN